MNLYPNVPRYFIERYFGATELGIFATMAYTVTAGIKLVDSLAQSVGPRLAGHHASGNESQFRMVLLKAMGIGLLFGAAGILLALFGGSTILTVFYGKEYAGYPSVLVWLAVAGAVECVSSFQYWTITAARRFVIQIPLYAVVVGVGIAASFWLVPTYGMRGAAIAYAIAATVRLCGGLAIIMHILYTLHSRVSHKQGTR